MTIHSRTGTESNRRDTDYKVNARTHNPSLQVQLRGPDGPLLRPHLRLTRNLLGGTRNISTQLKLNH